METEYLNKLQMVRAIQCHMLNTWTYVQTTPEFVCYKTQRAAHRAEQKAKDGPRWPNGVRRQRTPRLSKHDIQKSGALEGCAKCGRWEVSADPDAARKWKAPCNAGQRHATVQRNGHTVELSAAPKRRGYAWVCKRCGISVQLLHKLQRRSVQMGFPALFPKRTSESLQVDRRKRPSAPHTNGHIVR